MLGLAKPNSLIWYLFYQALFAEDPNLFPLLRASLRPSKSSRDVAVLLKFAQPDHARAAIAYFEYVLSPL